MQFSSGICSPLTLCASALPFNSCFVPSSTDFTPSSPLHRPFISPSAASCPFFAHLLRRNSLKLKCVLPCDEVPGLKLTLSFFSFFFIVSPAHRPRLMIPTLLHIFTFVTQFLILVQVCYSAQPPCVFPVAPACVFIIQTLRMCYKRSAINLLVP